MKDENFLAVAGEKDSAFGWLAQAIDEHRAWVSRISVHPQFDSLRKDLTAFRDARPASGQGG